MKKLVNNILGSPEDFSFENRGFTFICAITFVILSAFIPVNVFLGLHLANLLFGAVLIGLAILYYYSRFKKVYAVGAIIYSTVSYFFLAGIYLVNGGYEGPILLTFLLGFQLLLALTRSKHYPAWLALHIVFGTSLILAQYYFPGIVVSTYETEGALVIDTVVAYVLVLFFVYIITVFLLNNFKLQKRIAEQRARDIQVQKEELERLNTEKLKLFSIISHDLRSPLSTIQGYLEIMSEDSRVSDPAINRQLLNHTKLTLEMLSNLLNWSKVQLNGVSCNIQPLLVDQELRYVVNFLTPAAEAKDVSIELDVNKGLKVNADREMFRIVLRNLVSNAIKFCTPGKRVIVSTSIKKEEVIVSVKDEGGGVPKAFEDCLFKPVGKPAYGTANERGFGIGLLLCKEYTEAQGGRVWYQPGSVGATFCVGLPLVSVAQPVELEFAD